MRRFKSPGQAQRFLSAQGPLNHLCRCGRLLMRVAHYRVLRAGVRGRARCIGALPSCIMITSGDSHRGSRSFPEQLDKAGEHIAALWEVVAAKPQPVAAVTRRD